jgi:hypothetical protein
VRVCVPCPCPRSGGHVLRALRVGVCAVVLLLVSTAFALASTTEAHGLAAARHTAKRDRQVLRFFANHKWLLEDPRFAAAARRQIAAHSRSLAAAERELAAHRVRARRKRAVRRLASVRVETPEATICRVFGPRCGEAIRVARCESGMHTDAVNGQYLGLFQMGSHERQLFGHGPSAQEQASAAHRYFVYAGQTWSPWSCRP